MSAADGAPSDPIPVAVRADQPVRRAPPPRRAHFPHAAAVASHPIERQWARGSARGARLGAHARRARLARRTGLAAISQLLRMLARRPPSRQLPCTHALAVSVRVRQTLRSLRVGRVCERGAHAEASNRAAAGSWSEGN